MHERRRKYIVNRYDRASMSEVKDAYVAMGGVMSIPISDKIHDALVRFQHQPITPTELARFVDMNDAEIETMRLYWNPVFNKSDIYLSPEVICDHFGYSKPSNFYRCTAFKKCVMDGSVTGVDVGHSLVVAYKTQCSDLSTGNKEHTGGSETNYYICSGITFKRLALAAGTDKSQQIHEYFIKVETLCQLMVEYISACQTHQLTKQLANNDETKRELDAATKRADDAETARKALEQKNAADGIRHDAELAASKHREERRKLLPQTMARIEALQYIYVKITRNQARKCRSKVGGSEDTPHLKTRGKKYGTGNDMADPDEMPYFCYIQRVHNFRTIESRLKSVLAQYVIVNPKSNRKTEMYRCPWPILKKCLDRIIASELVDFESFNETVAAYELVFDEPTIIPDEVHLTPLPTETKEVAAPPRPLPPPKINLNALDAAAADDLVKEILTSHIRVTVPAFEFATDSKQINIVLQWDSVAKDFEIRCEGGRPEWKRKILPVIGNTQIRIKAKKRFI